MKKVLPFLLVIIVVAVTNTQAQSKKDIEKDYANCVVARDSIQDALTGLSESYESLTKTCDSISNTCTIYDTMYNVIKEKVILYEFDPENISVLIDSLKSSRESAFSDLNTSLNDSISALNEENTKLKTIIEELESTQPGVVDNLKQLKELLDSQIITQEEFDTKKAILLEKL